MARAGRQPGRRAAGRRRRSEARQRLLSAFADLDERLATRRFLLGDRLTEADVRLLVSLVRYDAQANAERTINAGLPEFPHLWAYARDLYAQPAFHDTTDFATFTAAGATVPDWESPTDRDIARVRQRAS